MKNLSPILAVALLAALMLTGCSKPAPTAAGEQDAFAEMVYANPDSPAVIDSIFTLINENMADSAFVGGYVYDIVRCVIREGKTHNSAAWHLANALIEADSHRHLKSAYWCIERAEAANPDSTLTPRIRAARLHIDSLLNSTPDSQATIHLTIPFKFPKNEE